MILLLVSFALLLTNTLLSDPVPVRHTEGLVHGFLVLRTLEGKTIADGDLIQVAHGARVTCRLVFRFRDGSVHDETAIFSQRGEFRPPAAVTGEGDIFILGKEGLTISVEEVYGGCPARIP